MTAPPTGGASSAPYTTVNGTEKKDQDRLPQVLSEQRDTVAPILEKAFLLSSCIDAEL